MVGTDDVDRQLCEISGKMDDVPDRIHLIAGDFLYCLRSSLDQLVWCLARLEERTYPKHTQFPIYMERTPSNVERFKRHTRGVPAAAVTVIEGLQPYNAPDPKFTLLGHLNALCNIDKHRRLPVLGSVTDFPLSKLAASVIWKDEKTGKLFIPIQSKGFLDFEAQPKIELTFGDYAENLGVQFSGFERMFDLVANSIIPRFQRFFVDPI